MWVKQYHFYHPFGNCLYHIKMVMTGGWFMAFFFTHIWSRNSPFSIANSSFEDIPWQISARTRRNASCVCCARSEGKIDAPPETMG